MFSDMQYKVYAIKIINTMSLRLVDRNLNKE